MSSLNIQPVYQARELYPTAVHLFSIKRYDELIQICRNTRELNPIIAPYCYYLEIRALLVQGLIEESFDVLSEAERAHAGVPIIDEIF